MIDPKKIIEMIKKIPDECICYLWEIGQDHNYLENIWTLEDEFWRQVGYAMRIRG